MRTHQAKITISCPYRRHRPDGEFAFPEGPDPWNGEWKEIGRTPVENSEDGTAHECTITYQTDVQIWTPDKAKAEEMLTQWIERNFIDDTLPQLFAPNRWSRPSQTEISSYEIAEHEDVPLVHTSSIPWRLLVDPNMSLHGSWAKPKYRSVRIDAVFETLRDLMETASAHEDHPSWHNHQATSLLSGGDQGMHFGWGWKVSPVSNLEQIKQRFVHSLLASGHACYDDWRRDAGITLDAVHQVRAPLPRKSQPYAGASDLQTLFNLKGCKTDIQLNGMHPGAKNILAFGIGISPAGFVMLLAYGYEGSSWTQELARTRFNEPFLATLTRAKQQADRIVPDMRQVVSDKMWKERENA